MDFIAGYVVGSRGASRAAGLAASAAQFTSSNRANRMEDLVERVDRLTLVVEAMWSMLEADGHTEDELQARISELDASDGSEDGVNIARPRTCPNCNAKVGARMSTCQFCGVDIGEADPFAR